MLLPADQVDLIRIGALLANIGIIHVSEEILQKTTPLTEVEQMIIRRHPVRGAETLASVPQLKAVLPLVLHHHEDWAGGGYPSGNDGELIPLGARIIRVAETYDALTGTRPYRPAYSAAEALEMLNAGAGREFDPRVVTAFAMRMRRGTVNDELLDRWEEHQQAARAWRSMASAQGF